MSSPINHVEIPCKTTCKTQCKLLAKLCVNFTPTITHRVKLNLSHHIFTITPPAFTQPPTSGLQLIFPLFHQAYYYNY